MVPDKLAVHDEGACSACMNAFLLACTLLTRNLTRRIDVYLGGAGSRVPETEGPAVAFGNCCRYKGSGVVKIAGCPPYPYDLDAALRDMSVMDA